MKILFAAAGRDVDDTGALLLADLRPRDDAVLDAARSRQLVERALIVPLEHLGAAQVLLDVPAVAEHFFDQRFGEVHALAVLDRARVRQIRVDCRGDV